MSRKTVKRILFIFGAVITAFWAVLFITNMLGFVMKIEVFWKWTMLEMFIVAVIGLVPMSISMLMHAKDIKQQKRGFAEVIKALAIFWLVTSILMTMGIIVVSSIFGWDTYLITL